MFSAVLCVLFILAGSGCDSGGSQPDPDPEVTVFAEAVTENGSRVDSAGIYFDGQKVGEGTAQKTYTQDSDGSVTVSAQEDDYLSAEETVSLGADREVSLELQEELPETVTIRFENRAADGDSLVAGDLELAGTVVAENEMSGSFSASGSRETKQLCFVEQNFFDRSCVDLTPTSDQSVELRPERKQVTVAVTPKDSTGAVIPDAVTWVYEPYRADSTKLEGEDSAELPKRSGERTLVGDWITQEPNSSKLNRYRSGAMTVSARGNVDEQITVDQLIPACSDGIDNDGDDYADKADTRACTDLGGNYDPQDDNEILKGFTRVSGKTFDDSTFVSSAMNERMEKIRPAVNPLPSSVTVAKGSMEFAIEVSVTKDTSGEDFAIHLKTGGSNDNLTVEKTSAVVVDQDTADGIVLKEVFGIDRSFFADGSHYAVYMWHGTKARGEGYGDGRDRVFVSFGKEWNSANRTSFIYEPEDVPENKLKSAFQQARPATLKSGECLELSKIDTVCRVPARKTARF